MKTCLCGNNSSSSHSYCLDCKAQYMRNWRKQNKLTDEQRKKMNARSYLHVYVKRGKVIKTTCIDCGSLNSQASIKDYTKPLDVIWLCRTCRIKRIKSSRQLPTWISSKLASKNR